jgi:hypothetical protein
MAGLVPAIHVFEQEKEDVDARDKRGHDVRSLTRHEPDYAVP